MLRGGLNNIRLYRCFSRPIDRTRTTPGTEYSASCRALHICELQVI